MQRAVLQNRKEAIQEISVSLKRYAEEVQDRLVNLKRFFAQDGGGIKGIITDFVNAFGSPTAYIAQRRQYLSDMEATVKEKEKQSIGLESTLENNELRSLEARIQKLV